MLWYEYSIKERYFILKEVECLKVMDSLMRYLFIERDGIIYLHAKPYNPFLMLEIESKN
jgi:hypothetical protein